MRPLYQSDESYFKTLAELKRRIEAGVPLDYYDDTTPGDKNTECTWGLCDDKIQALQDGVYRRHYHVCPQDGRFFTETGERNQVVPEELASGCFWKCLIFKGRHGASKERIDSAIANSVGNRPADGSM